MEQRLSEHRAPERHENPGSRRLSVPELRVVGGERRAAWRRRLSPVLLVLSDALIAMAIWAVAHAAQTLWGQSQDLAALTAASNVAVWIGLRALLGLYPGYGLDEAESLRRHTYSVLAAVATISVVALGLQIDDRIARPYLVFGFLGLLVLVPPLQHLVRQALRRAGLWGQPVLVLGSKGEGARTAELLDREWVLGYEPVAFAEFEPASDSVDLQRRVLSRAAELARRNGADTAVFAMPYTRREQVAGLVGWASARFRQVLVIPNLGGVTNSAVVARDLAGTFAVEVKYNLLDPWALRSKRAMELAATLLGGVVALPLIGALALLVYLESGGGPVFYRDKRMGRHGELFSCLKFRTMVPGAEDLLQRVLEEDAAAREEYAMYHKLRDDPRVTRVGRFLRKTSLDELPQLWNVMKGEMSLVGPRPYLPRETAEIGSARAQILRVPPGITGLWQVDGRNQASFGDRVAMDAYYVRDWSVWLDVVILARTAKTVLLARGAY